MICEVKLSHKKELLSMFEAFYRSEAVLQDIPYDYHLRTLEDLFSPQSLQKAYIFEVDGTAVGYALLSYKFSHEAGGRELWLEEFYVRDAYRRQGLGREFLSFLTRLQKQEGICRLRLEVEPENIRAARLYEEFGFQNLPYAQMSRKGDFL